MTLAQLEDEVKRGGRFVVYEYCISILVMTFTRSSGIHYVPPGKSAVVRGLGFTTISLLLGWWGIPWGLIRTPMALATNLGGGKKVTSEIMIHFRKEMGVHPPGGAAEEAVFGRQASA
jgi:hypothetical protein